MFFARITSHQSLHVMQGVILHVFTHLVLSFVQYRLKLEEVFSCVYPHNFRKYAYMHLE